MKDLRNALAKARDEYFASERGKVARDPLTLKAPTQSRRYLTNRLEAAFIAGWEARQRNEAAEKQT